MSYKIEYTNQAKETLRRIPRQDTIRILRKIEWIAQHADQLQHRRIQNPPPDLEKICRYRVGIYRVLYWIEHGSKTITIYDVIYRKGEYKELYQT